MAGTDIALRYARFMLRHRRLVIGLLCLSTLLALIYVPQVNLRNDPDSLLPLSNPYIATNLYADNTYGMGNLMVWGFKLKQGDIYQPWFLDMLDRFYAEASELPFANAGNFAGLPSHKMRNLGLAEDGSLDFGRLFPGNGLAGDPQQRQAQIDYLREGLQRHMVLQPLLVYYEDASGNKCNLLDAQGAIDNASIARVHEQCLARGTFIIGDFNAELKEQSLDWIRDANALLERYQAEYGDRVEFLVSGEPYFLATMIEELWDKAWLFGISLLIVVFVLRYQFRHWSCAVFPVLGVGMTIVLTLGLMGFTGFRLTTMMALTPMLLLAIGIGHAMQITRRFMQEMQTHANPHAAAIESIRHTMVPAALSIGTDLHGFFAISFVDISFYKAYAYFGIFGMSTLILTTTTLIPLLLVSFPPHIHDRERRWGWEDALASGITRMLTGGWKWVPLALATGILLVSAHYAELPRGVAAILASEEESMDAETVRIREEFDVMPGVEKGIHYPRAAFKDHYLLGEILHGDGTVRPIADLDRLSAMMPGVITANLVIRSRAGTLPACGMDAWNDAGERIIGPERCFDEQEDPPQGIFNDAEVLAALSRLEDWLRGHPDIGFTTSYVQFLKTLNMMVNAPAGESPTRHANLYAIPTLQHMQANLYAYQQGDDPQQLPDPDAAVRLYNGMLLASAGAGELDGFINTRTWNEGIIVAFANTLHPARTHRVVRDIQDYVAAHSDEPGMRKLRIGIEGGERIPVDGSPDARTIVAEDTAPGKVAIGGFLGVTEATRDVAFQEWLHAPAMTSLTVFLMAAIMFRSWLVATILIGLCFVTLMSQYGLGGYMSSIGEWSANLAFHVQVALSIAMGLGVDYAVYMVARLREEMRSNGHDWKRALHTTLSTTGSAVIISVVVLLGSMLPLMNTELANLWSVSLYIAEALVLDVLLALMLLPYLIYRFKPRFVFGRD
jgi:predicted RND superfamily exporter protein